MEKIIVIAYWHLTKFNDLSWEHEADFPYSEELRNQIITECLNKGYSVMVEPRKYGIRISIDNGRFRQR